MTYHKSQRNARRDAAMTRKARLRRKREEGAAEAARRHAENFKKE